jgi:SAM-dependent methyltransferase
MVAFACPACRTPLDGYLCPTCARDYEGPLGTWDLTETEPEAVERELIERLDEPFSEILAWYLKRVYAEKTPAQLAANQAYIGRAIARSEDMVSAFFDEATRSFGERRASEAALDLGCGMGAALIALAKRFDAIVGVDLNRKHVLLAAARLRDAGVEAQLACTSGDKLPLPDGSLDACVAVNVLEHLVEYIGPTLEEIRRVLRPGGLFCADSRNRYDLVFPEPHVRLRWVGLMPRAAQQTYVSLRGGPVYKGTRLLSRRELLRLVRRHLSDDAKVGFMPASAFGRSARWNVLTDGLARVPLVRKAALDVFPSHVIVARRGAS